MIRISTDSQVEIPELRKAAYALEGLFVQQMYKAMRATVPENATSMKSTGESIFSDMLDEHIAADTPERWESVLGEAIYRQLCSNLGNQSK